MKKPKDISDLAIRLSNAATTPLVTAVQSVEDMPEDRPRKAPKRRSVSVFLRLPQDLYNQFDQEAVDKTRATGRGVSVQQVILHRLMEGPGHEQ